MITKERLEELIKQKAKIWGIGKHNNVFCVDLSRIARCKSSLNNTEWHNNKLETYSRLFETKEDAEWEFEFGNITRIETLSLPTWEEMIKEVVYEQNIYGYDGKNYVLIIENYGNEPTIKISCSNDYSGIFEAYDKPLTKENYLEACELCRKLFLGEDV